MCTAIKYYNKEILNPKYTKAYCVTVWTRRTTRKSRSGHAVYITRSQVIISLCLLDLAYLGPGWEMRNP